MTREKRTAHVQALVFPTTQERMKRRVARMDNVTSISDYLFLLIEKDLRLAEDEQVVKQIIGGRIGKN